jgi:hypothetical protein
LSSEHQARRGLSGNIATVLVLAIKPMPCASLLKEVAVRLYVSLRVCKISCAVQRQVLLDQRAMKLAQQADALTLEKQQMTAVGTGSNDVLELNVGGVLLSVKRSTLTQVLLKHIGWGSAIAAFWSPKEHL